MPSLPTGLSSADAQDDFVRARRREALRRLARRVSRERGDIDVILPFDEVVRALGRTGERQLGLQVVDLDSIVGTVDRLTGFDRAFRPTNARVRARWERIAGAVRRGEPMPPVSLYRIGEVHFVKDGHHRVSVARAMGWQTIDAYVTEVLTKVGAERGLRMEDLPHKSNERLFRERVPLPQQHAARISLTDADDYPRLAEGVEAWGFRDMQARGDFLDRGDVARQWFEREYDPVTRMLRDAGMLVGGTETDCYLRVAEERYRLLQSHDWSEEILTRLRRARGG